MKNVDLFLKKLWFACFRGRGLGDDPTQTLESAPRQTGSERYYKKDESKEKLPGHTVSHTLPGSDDQPPGPLGTCTP